MIRGLIGAIGLSVMATHALAAEPIEIGIGYLRHAGVKSMLSLVAQPADNDGVAGALLAIEDNNTTGKFLNQHFILTEVKLKENDDVAAVASSLADHDGFIIADLPADELLKVADTLRDRGTVLLDAGAIDDRLREEVQATDDCEDLPHAFVHPDFVPANAIPTADERLVVVDWARSYLRNQCDLCLCVVDCHHFPL